MLNQIRGMIRIIKEYFIIKKSNLFDEQFYLQNYPDVRRADVDPLSHYIKYGWREGRNPSAKFDTNAYRSCYPDVMQANINPLFHYVYYGQREGRLGGTHLEKCAVERRYGDRTGNIPE